MTEVQAPPPPPTPKKPGRSNTTAALMAIGVVVLALGFVSSCTYGCVRWVTKAQNDFNLKARHTEAKTELAELYKAEKAHIAEKGSATSDFEELELTNEDLRRYHIYIDGKLLHPLNESHDSEEDMDLLNRLCPDCTIEGERFKAAAIGSIDDDPDFDVWTIDQDKKLEHTHDDLSSQE